MRYLGHHNTDRNKIALTRNCIDCNVTPNVTQFLHEMGFRFDFEFVLSGYMFCKGIIKILVYKMYKLNSGSGIASGMINPILMEQNQEPLTKSHLIEMSVMAPVSSVSASFATDMKQFADLLKPLVVLENVDMRNLNI